MTYEILENPENIRQEFVKKNVIDQIADKYMWEVLTKDAAVIPFEDAVKKLKTYNNPVYFISEAEGNPSFNNCALEEYEEDKKGFAAVADADWLAEMIDYEWVNKSTMWEDGFNLGSNDILPDDLYVFDKENNWFLVFTHEITGNNIDTRYCLSYNI